MRKKLLLVLTLLLPAVWLQAQDTMGKASNNSGPTTIAGCLQSGGGVYTLTESDGTVHRLSGYANKLGKHVGHQVQITGKPGVKTISTTQQNIASSATEIHVFNVKNVTHVGDSCNPPAK
jgi:hypothetical protein